MERQLARGKMAGVLASMGAALRRASGNLDEMKKLDETEENARKEMEQSGGRKDKRIGELERKVAELEEKMRQMEELGGGIEERRVRDAERKLEEEMKDLGPMTEEGWEKEKEERKAAAGRLVITGLDMEDTKERVEGMLEKELGRRFEVTRLNEKKGKDGMRRWFYELDSEEEKRSMVSERGERIKEKWNMKVSGDRTYRERKTKQIMDRRAGVEGAKNKAVKIRVTKNLICVDGSWEAWDEKEAKWVDEKEWRRREAWKEKERLEEELRKLGIDLERKEDKEPEAAAEGMGGEDQQGE